MNKIFAICSNIALWFTASLILSACSSGGSSNNNGNTNSNPNTSTNQTSQQSAGTCTATSQTAWAVSDAGNSGFATNIVTPCDKFEYEANVTTALLQWDTLWQTLIAARTWTDQSNPLYTYSFYEDVGTPTNFGRAYRYTGFDVSVGPIRTPMAIVGPGIYTAANGSEYQAMILQTWNNDRWQMLILQDERNFAKVNQHTNGYPIVSHYSY